jgi:tRNA threonylcarbamoyladenosine biosynthesis protein TsaE
MEKVFYTTSAAETKKSAMSFAKKLRKGDVISLIGDLGSGKTTFVQGLAAGLGIKEGVKSPSFTVVNEYAYKDQKLFHIDLYRLGENDFDSLGLDDYIFGGGIAVIEWADRVMEDRLKASYRIKIFWEEENKRKIVIDNLSQVEYRK